MPFGHEHLLGIGQQLAGSDGRVGSVRECDGLVKHRVAVDLGCGVVDEPFLRERVGVGEQTVLHVLLGHVERGVAAIEWGRGGRLREVA